MVAVDPALPFDVTVNEWFSRLSIGSLLSIATGISAMASHAAFVLVLFFDPAMP
ncbi:hypothetical protein [Glycomyces halotolerans]